MEAKIRLRLPNKTIKLATEKARKEGLSLNDLFLNFLSDYLTPKRKSYQEILKSLESVKVGRKFSRDEMNER